MRSPRRVPDDLILQDCGQHANAPYEMPRHKGLDQKFGLLALFHGGVLKVCGGDGGPVDLAELVCPVAKFGVTRTGVRKAEAPAGRVRIRLRDHLPQVQFQMKDRPLSAPVGQFRVVGTVDQEQHD